MTLFVQGKRTTGNRIQNRRMNWIGKDLNTLEIVDSSPRPTSLNLAFFLLYLGQNKLLIPSHLSDTLSRLQILIPTLSEFQWYKYIAEKKVFVWKQGFSEAQNKTTALYFRHSDNKRPLCDCTTILNPAGAWRTSYWNTEICNNTHNWRLELCAVAILHM